MRFVPVTWLSWFCVDVALLSKKAIWLKWRSKWCRCIRSAEQNNYWGIVSLRALIYTNNCDKVTSVEISLLWNFIVCFSLHNRELRMGMHIAITWYSFLVGILCLFFKKKSCAIKSILTYGSPFQGFPGRECSELIYHSFHLGRGLPGTVQTAQSYTSWLYSQEAQWGM